MLKGWSRPQGLCCPEMKGLCRSEVSVKSIACSLFSLVLWPLMSQQPILFRLIPWWLWLFDVASVLSFASLLPADFNHEGLPLTDSVSPLDVYSETQSYTAWIFEPLCFLLAMETLSPGSQQPPALWSPSTWDNSNPVTEWSSLKHTLQLSLLCSHTSNGSRNT